MSEGRHKTKYSKARREAFAIADCFHPQVEGFPSRLRGTLFFLCSLTKHYTMFRIEMNVDDEWSCVAMVAKDSVDETLALHSVGGDKVRAVEVVDNDALTDEGIREQQDRDYEACLREDQERERAKAKEERHVIRQQRQEQKAREKNRPGLEELRQRRLRFYDFQNRRVTRSVAKRLNPM